MANVELSYRLKFSASHRLHNPALSDEENRRIFDKCNHVNGHGHNYDLHITVKGPVSESTGMVMSTMDIERIAQTHVLDKVDHRYLNMDVEEFKTLIPTVENIAVIIWNWLRPVIGPTLYEVRLHETEDCVAIYRGE